MVIANTLISMWHVGAAQITEVAELLALKENLAMLVGSVNIESETRPIMSYSFLMNQALIKVSNLVQ